MSAKKIVISEPMEVYKIVGRVNTIGLEETAKSLDAHPSTLSRWLATQGYVMIRTWELKKAVKPELEPTP